MKREASEASSKSAPSRSSVLAKAALRDAPLQGLAALAGQELAVQVGDHIARRQRVDPHAVARQVDGQRLGQVDHRGLGGAVGGELPARPQAHDRGHVDDRPAVAEARHVPADLLSHQPDALQVGVDHPVPVRLGLLQARLEGGDAGVVDQDRDRPQLGLRGRHAGRHAGTVGDVERHRNRPAVEGLDLARQFGQTLDPPGRQSDLGAGPRARGAAAQAAGGAGDDRHPVAQVEGQISSHRTPAPDSRAVGRLCARMRCVRALNHGCLRCGQTRSWPSSRGGECHGERRRR